jgi:DNA-binding SARP family transcriptional activator
MGQELWGERPPASASTTIQTYMGRLRRVLATILECDLREVCREVLVTHQEGYSLNIDPEVLDAHRFERLARLGSRSLTCGHTDEASRLLSDALALWRGPALVDVRTGPLLQLEVTRLTVARLAALEQRIAADLELGRHYEVLAELADLTARHPLDETLHQHYMVALYRTGRRMKALEVYHQLRSVLAVELGLEPCRTAQRIHQAILRADPELDDLNRRVA